MFKYIIIVIWVSMGIFTAGAINADFRGNFPNNYKHANWARSSCAEFIGVSLFAGPFGFIMSPFSTGFYQHGWTLSCAPLKE